MAKLKKLKRSPEKDVLLADVMTPQQLDPGLARANEFTVGSSTGDLPGHAQCGRNAKEYASVKAQSPGFTGENVAPKPVTVVPVKGKCLTKSKAKRPK